MVAAYRLWIHGACGSQHFDTDIDTGGHVQFFQVIDGLTGGVDTVLVLKRERGQADASLFATGREIDEVDWALQFDKDTGLWLKIGDGAEYRRSKEQIAIRRHLDDGPATPTEVAKALETNLNPTKSTMRRMAKAGDLVNTGGRYSLP